MLRTTDVSLGRPGIATRLTLVLCSTASGQSARVGDPVEDYLRVLQMSGQATVGSSTVRPLSVVDVGDVSEAPHPWSERLKVLLPDRGPGPLSQVGRGLPSHHVARRVRAA